MGEYYCRMIKSWSYLSTTRYSCRLNPTYQPLFNCAYPFHSTLNPGISPFLSCSALQELNKLDDAEKHYKITVALKPDHFISWSNMGYLYQKKDLWDESIHSFEEAARISPDDVDTHINLGRGGISII